VGKRKGVFDLLPALRRLKDAGLRFRMVFVGPGEREGEWEQALQMREWLGVADVAEFTGTLQGDDLYGRFRAGDVFVMPSYTEGLPVVLFEAGVFQMPVVTTPVGAIPDLIAHERNGLLVEPGRTDQIVAAIEWMVRDHDTRERLGRQLKQDVQAFHPDRVCALIARALRETLATP
jgi:glycosyltransferase involved in cell wall biosynthesis